MIEKFNDYVKMLNASKPFKDMPDWGMRVDSATGKIEMENTWLGVFMFRVYLDTSDNKLACNIAYECCSEFSDCTQPEIDYRRILDKDMQQHFPQE